MQNLGLIALLILFPLGIILLTKWPSKKGISFSENVAQQQSSQLLFSVGFTVVTLLYYAFLAFWLGPHYTMPLGYYITLAISFIAQLFVAWVPAKGKKALWTHTIASYIVAIVMLIIAGFFAFGVPGFASWLVIACYVFIIIGFVMAMLYLFVPKAKRHYLIYEIVYFLCFWLLILLLTYVP